jgi:hypothetical protein
MWIIAFQVFSSLPVSNGTHCMPSAPFQSRCITNITNMKTNTILLIAGMLLAVPASGFAQPTITLQPQSQTNVLGSGLTLAVEATGTLPLSYQWRRSGATVAGATDATLVFTNLQSSHAGNYTVVITNSEGAVTSSVAFVRVLVPPSFTLQPGNQIAEAGDRATFTNAATGTVPLAYQWRFNGAALPGKTNTSLTLTNVDFTNAGDYTVVVMNVAGSITSQTATLTVQPPVFTKITNGSIVTNIGTGLACAWGDYDYDGFIDLIVTSGFDPVNNTAQKNILYHNNRDGTFTSVTNTPPTAEARDWRGCSWVDYDNDGHLDLFITSADAFGFASENELFRNDGNGSFTKMTSAAVGDIVPGGGDSEGPLWADYDRDGFVDVYVARYGADWLFRSNGDGTFAKVPNNVGIPQDNYESYHGMWGDYDNDGWPDLVLPIGTQGSAQLVRTVLYHALGDGTFANVQTGSIVTNLGDWAGPGWGDYDNDGDLDLFVCSRSRNQLPNLLYRNNGDGTFDRMTSNVVGSIVSDLVPIAFLNCAWGDYDNDGFLDLFVGVRGDGVSAVTNFLYHNNGNGSFTRVKIGKVANEPGATAFGCAWGDYDNDGFLDLFVARGGILQRATNLLYRNNGNSNGWIKIKLAGTVSNRSAIGAKVRVQATIRGQTMWQMREINTGSGFRASPLEEHFGLGDATNVDTVRIEWPSGTVQELHNVRTNQFLTITEPPRLSTPQMAAGTFQWTLAGARSLSYGIQVSSNLLNWADWTTVPITNATGRALITDDSAAGRPRRFYRATVGE